MKDTYKTITTATEEVIFKDKNSKFLGYAFPVNSEEEVKTHLDSIKKEHHSARHWCYAYQIGTEEHNMLFRANDDGEPNNTAGMPIYGQIQSFEVTNILIVVVRYFGGVKLGVSGLINAYKTTAQMAMESANIVTKTIDKTYLISCDYKNLNTVMRIIKERNLKIVSQKLELDCQIQISVRLKESQEIFELFERLYEINIKSLNE